MAAPVHPPRQLRRCVVPLKRLVAYIDHKTKELLNAKVHHANVDEQGMRLFLYLESEHDKPVTLDFDLDWDSIFGFIPCPITGKLTFVDDIVASREGVEQLQARIVALEAALIDNGIQIP